MCSFYFANFLSPKNYHKKLGVNESYIILPYMKAARKMLVKLTPGIVNPSHSEFVVSKNLLVNLQQMKKNGKPARKKHEKFNLLY